MQGTIGFENLRIECVIGDLPEERQFEQPIFVSVEVACDFSACARTDALKDTVDYVALANDCRKIAVEGKYAMLETYASEVLNRFLSAYPIRQASIRVRKPNGLAAADYSFVALAKEKD